MDEVEGLLPSRRRFLCFIFFGAYLSFCLIPCSDASANPTEIADTLRLSPGEGGFISTWLRLGPFAAPEYITAKPGGLASWHPAPVLTEDHVREGVWIAGKQVSLLTADSARIGLKPHTGTVTYLMGIIRAETESEVYLSSASTDGIEVSVNGKSLFFNDTHKRWIRKDVNLTRVSLSRGNNLVVIRLFKEMPGPWRTWLRFMNGDFERANITMVLPGAQSRLPEVFQASARLILNRTLLPYSGEVTIDCWLKFIGAKPLLSSLDKWSWSSIPARDATVPPPNLLHPVKTSYLLHRFSGLTEMPDMVQLQINGVSFSQNVNVRPGLLQKLFDIAHRLNSASTAEMPESTVESLEWRIDHLNSLMRKGDGGYDYLSRELQDTDRMVAAMERGEDPYANRGNQLQRRGYRSQVDGALHHYALYVPPGWRENEDKKYPLIVALHGLGGHPVKTLSVLFGHPLAEDETREQRIRFPGQPGRAPMFVLAPEAFGNSGYYALGERDVLEVLDIVKKRYRIDDSRIYMTGASMGGTGAARIPLHYPDIFAAAVPLCGYHNMRYYSQVRNQPLSSVENYLLDVHSNIEWVKNGTHLPLYMVHGTQDQPRQSRDLLEHYLLQGNDAALTLIDAGHNVWDDTYKDGWIFRHFSKYHRNPHPRKVQFRTSNLRYRKNNWLRIDDMTDPNTWCEIGGFWQQDGNVEINTQNVSAFTFFRDPELAASGFSAITIHGTSIPAEQIRDDRTTFVRKNNRWIQESFEPLPGTKVPGLSGPIGDAEYDSLLFVYGTRDPWEGALARRIIGHLKTPRYGMTIKWKIKADVAVTENDLRQYSIVIVGTPQGNSLLGRIQNQLPIQVRDNAIQVGNRKFTGNRTAASFIYPNPLNPARYMVVHTGTSREAIYYSGHLPSMVPDYVIYNASDWGYTEGYVLVDDRNVLLSGFFNKHWQIDPE